MESQQPITNGATTPVIANVVATASLHVSLNLRQLAQKLNNAVYNPRAHPPVVVRMREPKSTALIHANGKMVITGAESEALAKLAARKHARQIQRLGYTVHFRDFRIQNIVASAKVGGPNEGLRLANIKNDYPRNVSYEPENFPMLMFWLQDPKVTCTISINGKITVNGARNFGDTCRGWEKIVPIVRPYLWRFAEPMRGNETPETGLKEMTPGTDLEEMTPETDVEEIEGFLVSNGKL